tara:strand:- start:15055 stop:15657 length:603 start_codon:yes stop_codon:yes gene_type:complete
MFTGIIQAKGKIKKVHLEEKGAVFIINSKNLDLSDSSIGDSIAVNGVCLTATSIDNESFTVDVSQETLNCSTFSKIHQGESVNLEKSLRFNQGVDGHLVSGHIDGIGEICSIEKEGSSSRLNIKVKNELVKYIAKKGSISINGVSLTVNAINNNVFDVNIVPHTFFSTTLGELTKNSFVNIEIDIIARHLEQLISNKDNL